MSLSLSEQLPKLLHDVERPARYVGAEVNSIAKNRDAVRASMLLAFPDVYDVGMSYHGFKILYERINAVAEWAAERTFAPWPDMEGAMREAGVPLFSLETKTPAAQFDLIGFTLQHEVNYTNVLNMIDLAGLPVESALRTNAFPLIIAGGEGALSPEPLAPFIDVFVLGDGEQVALELMAAVEEFKRKSRNAECGMRKTDKEKLLQSLAQIPGIYIPAFYEADYNADGTMRRFYAVGKKEKSANAKMVEPVLLRRALFNLARDLGPVKPVIPSLRVIHDRLSIEIKRGCARGCRFCAAGMMNRPVRERTPDQILEIARQGLGHTGFDEISLLSLSSADHSCILPAVRMLQAAFEVERVSISLPSLRINSFDVSLADEMAQVRKSGFTFAPEAGTERLRAVINKPLDEEAFLKIVELVCRKGWKTLKFYFMIGLPTETDADLDGIVALVKRAEEIGRRRWNNALQINVGLSPFVPKPHTPFQWAAQLPAEELNRRHYYVANRLRNKRISIKGHDRQVSFIEAVLARGDRRMSAAIRRAWELGCKFDGWDEFFDFNRWMQAFAESGIDPAFYANRERGADEILPWDHIDAGPGKAFLLKEWQLAQGEKTVPDCSTGACVGCDVCNEEVDHVLANEQWQSPPELLGTAGRYEDLSETIERLSKPRRGKNGALHEKLTPPPILESERERPKRSKNPQPTAEDAGAQRLRFRFSRTGDLRYLSHLDVIKVLQLACVRAGLKPSYTLGFNPRPKMSFMPPLPLGYETLCDYFDLILLEVMIAEECMERLNRQLPPGLLIDHAAEVGIHAQGPEAALTAAEYRIQIDRAAMAAQSLTGESFAEATKKLAQADSLPFERPATENRVARQMDLKVTLLAANEIERSAEGATIALTISHKTGEYADPLACLNVLLGSSFALGEGVAVARSRAYLAS